MSGISCQAERMNIFKLKKNIKFSIEFTEGNTFELREVHTEYQLLSFCEFTFLIKVENCP